MQRRLVNLFAGLVLFGFSLALMVEADLGLPSWDVLHQGISERTDLGFGVVVVVVSVVVLLLWVPLRQRPGVGTLANAIVVGLAAEASLAVLPDPDNVAVRAVLLGSGLVINGVATAMYIGAGMGPGPRDGLMTGLAAKGLSIRVARTALEIAVLGIGWLLGGSVGLGTVLFAFGIGPLVQYFMPRFALAPVPAGGLLGD